MATSIFIPHSILVEGEFFGREYANEGLLIGTVIAILRDRSDDQYAVFEMADMAGLFTIHLGSNFFRGWSDR
jgi:hypothetical protein